SGTIFGFYTLLLASYSAATPEASSVAVGFRVTQIPAGPQIAVWYTTTAREALHTYGRNATGSVALNAAPERNRRYPLIVFSHGWGGCATQSVFLTEQLARAGYVVAAPNHQDAGCGLDGRGLPRLHIPQLPFP